ncbi:hypothetical protein C823_006232 [Eubacterium plexicaudatum ASF492]|nr:hypothetical protein C823_006232 [Eubacterium plexicaudatum ASF492]
MRTKRHVNWEDHETTTTVMFDFDCEKLENDK